MTEGKPDWTKLPDEFHYLVEATERYGSLTALWQPPRRRLKKREKEELREVALKIGWHNHDLQLQSWLVQHSIMRDSREVELVEGLLILLEYLGFDVSDYGPKQEPQWTLHLWETLHYNVLKGYADELRDVLSDSQAFEVAVATLGRVPTKDLGDAALWMLKPFRSSRALDWIESHATAIKVDEAEAISLRERGFEMDYPEAFSLSDWSILAAVSEFSWPRAESWLSRGRPLSLVALITLIELDGDSDSPIVQEADPALLDPVPIDSATRILRDYAAEDRAPWVERAVERILSRWPDIIKPAR